jgi:MFS transporter, DHA2 family, multidrug resistance protein
MDYIGFGLLTLWIGCLQVMLDKGQDADWFSSTFIWVLAGGAALGFIVFVFWELNASNPIVNLRVLLNRNLAIGAVVIFVAGAIMNGTTTILPQFLQNLMNSGLVIGPRGLGAIAGTLLAGRILSELDGRAFIAQAAVLLAVSMYWLGPSTSLLHPATCSGRSSSAALPSPRSLWALRFSRWPPCLANRWEMPPA